LTRGPYPVSITRVPVTSVMSSTDGSRRAPAGAAAACPLAGPEPAGELAAVSDGVATGNGLAGS
jgi:hypothetical protein